jgi:hypothetical protein
MLPVQGGTQKLTMGPDPREYEALKNSMLQQHAQNSTAMDGIRQVMSEGVGTAVKRNKTEFGNSNVMVNELIQGADSNFAQKDVPGNAPLEDYMNQSGNLKDGVSSTTQAQRDVEDMESDALNKRLAMYREAAGNAGANLNHGYA